MIAVALLAVGIVAVAAFVCAAGIVSEELCACPYECGEHAAKDPKP